MTPDEAGALHALATETPDGRAVIGDGPGELHASWRPYLDRHAAAGLVFAYTENGDLDPNPGRTIYEITSDGLDALAAYTEQDD